MLELFYKEYTGSCNVLDQNEQFILPHLHILQPFQLPCIKENKTLQRKQQL